MIVSKFKFNKAEKCPIFLFSDLETWDKNHKKQEINKWGWTKSWIIRKDKFKIDPIIIYSFF